MVETHSKRHAPTTSSAPSPERSAEAADDLTRLCNRIAVLTFAAAFGLVVGLVTLSTVLASDAAALGRIVASLPLLAAVAAALRVRRLRAELHAMRARRRPPAPTTPVIAPDTSGASRASQVPT